MESNTNNWFVYILRCQDNSLYTGITIDMTKRLYEHNNTGKGAKYTRTRRPVQIVYYEKFVSRSQATIREFALKKLRKQQKENLIRTFISP